MPTPTKAPKPPPPPPPKPQSNAVRPTTREAVVESDGIQAGPEKIVIFGTGGIGKTELLANMGLIGKQVKILDLDDGSRNVSVKRAGPFNNWTTLRTYLQDESKWQGIDVVGIDSLTRAEELAIDWTLENVTNDKGQKVRSIEGYGYGKGYQHVYDTFLTILADLDQHRRAGRDVVLVCHECTSAVPNPAGDDYICYQPRLQSLSSGKSSIRYRIKEWADHVFFVGYDVFSEDGKATGSGTRTIYAQEQPTHWAKTRAGDRIPGPIPYEKGSARLWVQLFGKDVADAGN